MAVVKLGLDDADTGKRLREHLASVRKIRDETKRMPAHVAAIGQAWKMANAGIDDHLTKLAGITRASKSEFGSYQRSLDSIVQELVAMRKALDQSGKGLRDNKRDTKSAADKLRLLGERQSVANRLMKQGGVSAKAGGAAARLYSRDLGKLGQEGLELARKLDRAQKETLDLSRAQRAAAGVAVKHGTALGALAGKVVALVGAYVGIQTVFRLVRALALGSVDAFADLQDAVVSLRKVTDDLGDKGLSRLVDRLEELSTGPIPIATENLIELAAVAGTLGIQTEAGLANAAATGAKLAAATDLAADAAIKGLARILAIQGESVDMIDNLGSSLTELGNTSRATEAEILPVANEIARSTANFKIGADTILGFSAALAEMGAKAEGSGSALAELFGALLMARETGEGLEDLASIAGVTAEELRTMTQGNIAEAAVQFLQGLGTFGDRGAIALEKVGLASKRTSKALLPMAANADRLADRLRVSSKASEENTALNKEAAAAFSTLRSDGQRLTNQFRLLLADGIGPLSEPMSRLLGDTADLIGAWRDFGEGLKEIPGITAVVSVGLKVLSDRLTKPIKQLTLLPKLLAVLASVELGKLASTLEAVAKFAPLGTGAPILAMASDLRELETGFLVLATAQIGAKDSHEDLLEVQSEVPRIVGDALDATGAMTDQLGVQEERAKALAKALSDVARGQLNLRSVIPAPAISPSFLPGGFQPGLQRLDPQGRPISGASTFGSMQRSKADKEAAKAAEESAKRLDGLSVAADILQDSFRDMGGPLGEIARALPGFLEGLKALRSGAPGGKKEFAAGLINLATGLASKAFGFTGQRGPGEFGEDISGDFSDVGGQAGEIAGAIVGSVVGPLGTVLGAAIGKFLGTIIGGLVKSGADELIVGATQVGDRIEGVVSRAEGPLGELGAQMSGAFEEIFSALEGVIGGSISIQASEIIGGPEIKAAGEAAVIKLRDGVFRLFMDGVVQEFGTIDEALEAATLGLLAKAEFGEGVSEAVVAALTSGAGSLEELDERLEFALGFDKLLSAAGPVELALDEIFTLLRVEGQKLKEIGLPASLANQLLAKRISLLGDEIEAELRSVAGITDHAATLDRLAQENADFTDGIDSQRASLEAQLAAQRELLAAQTMSNEVTRGVADELGDFSGALIESRDGIMGFVTTGRNLNSTLADSERGMASTASEIAVLEEALAGLPDALDPDLLAQALGSVALSAADDLFSLLNQFKGFSADTAALEAARNDLARGQIALQIQGLRNMLATTAALDALSISALKSAIAAGETVLAGDLRLGRPGGGGGGRRAEAQREAEAAVEAQDIAAESFADAMLGFRQELSATSAEQQAFSDRVKEFRDLAAEAGAPLENLNQGLQMMAEIDIREIGDAWETTAAQFRASDLEGAVRDIGQRRTAAIEDVNIREDLSPDAAREAKKNIRETTRREFEALGKAALKGLGGALSNLTRTGKETVKTIDFLVRNADKLGLSLSQIGRTVRDQVLGPLLALARSEAERVGDTEEAARIAARQGKIAIALKTAELILARQMLEAAGALSRSLGRLIDDTIARLGRPTATDPTRGGGGLTGGRTGARSSAGGSRVDLAAIARDIEGILEGFRRARLGPTATSAAALAQQLKDVRDQARLANFDLGRVAEAFAVARAEFVKTALDAIGPAESLNASASALDDVEQRFVDVVAGLMIVGAGAEALADAGDRLVLASDLIEDNLKVGIRQEIEELRNLTAPSNKVVFDEAQARFEELAATALDESLTNAQRAEALEALADASQAFRTETIERFGAGPGTQPILDAILATLEQVEAADILVTTDRQILEAQAASLAKIELTTAAQPTAASSAASFSSLETTIASLGGGIIDPALLAILIENLNGTQMQVEATISELVDVLGADIFADVVEAIGALPFADLVNSLDAAGLDFGGFVDQLGGIDLSDLDFGEIVSALGPFGSIVRQLGEENFAEIVAALQPIIAGTSGTEGALKDENGAMISKLASMKDSLRAGGGIQVKLTRGLDFTGRNTGPGSVQGELRTMSSILAGLQSFHTGGIAQSTGLALLREGERVLPPGDTVRFDAGQFLAPVAPAGGDSGDLVAEVRSLKAQVAELTRITEANAATRVDIANMQADQADAALAAALRSAAATEMTAEHTEGEGDEAR